MRVLFTVLFLSFSLTVNAFSQTNSAQQYFEKGSEFAKDGKYEQSIDSYTKSLKSVKKDKQLKAKIHYNIGVGFYQLKKFKDAEKSFEKAIKINKKYIQAIYSLGLTQIELEKLNSAKSSFRKVIGLDEKHAEAWFDLGMVLLKEEKNANAKIAFEKAIEYKTKRSSEAQNNLGVIANLQGNIDLAIEYFQIAYIQSGKKLLLAKRNFQICSKHKSLQMSKLLAVK